MKINRSMRTLALPVMATTLALGTHHASAQFVGTTYDFAVTAAPHGGTVYNGDGVLDPTLSTPVTWNQIPTSGTAPYTSSSTKTDTGATGSISLTLAPQAVYGSTAAGDGAGSMHTLLSQYAIANGGHTDTFSFNGLTAGDTYNIVLYGDNADYGSSGAAFTIGGVAETTSGGSAAAFTAGVNYVEYTGIAPVSGTITGTWSANPGSEGEFNGAQIQVASVVPEPGTWAMLLCGLASLVGFRWFNRKSA
jgi:hypothetical protein